MSILDNTTIIQTILDMVNELPEADSGNIDNEEISTQTTLISETINKMDKLGVIKYYTVTYDLSSVIVSSNTSTKIKSGTTYETTLSIASNTYWDKVVVTMNGETIFSYSDGDKNDINIVIENVTGDIVITASKSSIEDDW